ncbi:structural cement protein Gp24 [Stenotrophomonas maltophilia]|uniref:structural cement protein Gp24 n=1 Tax=Stenotrophomonas maltophilia TaxID=40324 RepID=UPI000C25AB42|nr:DUF2190 family protein [Stenotrophomonas maltophilia]PJL44741.1 hypothetical protein B9Y56_08640 [Stenotrophomonas maltophilia]
MALQTNYPDIQPAAIAGAPATMLPATEISRTVEGAAIAFGKAVEQGATDKSVKTFAGGKYVGIAMLDRSASGLTVTAGQVTGRATDAFGVGESARVRTKGDLWVTAAVAVAAGDDVYLTDAGAFTNVSTDNTAIPGARWDTSTTAVGQLAVVRLG